METGVDPAHGERAGGRASPAEGTETYLFTDIEGSTRLLQRLGARFSEALGEQRRLLLTAVERHRGAERGTAGNGSFIVFRSARDAVLTAAAAQLALSAQAWPDGEQIRVRVGMHSGESAVVDAVYSGLDVFRAARIAAAGHGVQVLLSQATRELVERDLPDGLSLLDLGSHAQKDLDRSERISQLVVAGLAHAFPPLKLLEVPRDNLPLSPTTFVGRGRELEAARSRTLRARPTRASRSPAARLDSAPSRSRFPWARLRPCLRAA